VLRLESPEGGGTRLSAEIPLGPTRPLPALRDRRASA
jgi:hypothetical protein